MELRFGAALPAPGARRVGFADAAVAAASGFHVVTRDMGAEVINPWS